MKIAGYVGDLLYDYECVVIPGLGGFIAEDQSVTINKVTDRFSPPFRNVHFNIHLRANDGLLINYVAQHEEISYKAAKQNVDKFVLLCHNALESGKKINFKNIGSIAKDSEGNITFKQDTSVNYKADSFGLGTLVSPSIRRVSDEDKIKKVVKSAIDKTKSKPGSSERIDKKVTEEKKPVSRKMQANRRKSSLTNQIIFLAFVMFAMGIAYVYMRRDAMKYYFDRYSSHIPFFYSSVNDYLATNINSTPVAKLSRSTASLFPVVINETTEPVIVKSSAGYVTIRNNSTSEESKENDSEVSNVETTKEETLNPVVTDIPIDLEKDDDMSGDINNPISEISEPKQTNIGSTDLKSAPEPVSINRFFIIAGSFSKESNAKRLVDNLRKEGFNALIADTNKYGMYRVAFDAFSNRSQANKELLAIRNENDPKAWLLVK